MLNAEEYRIGWICALSKELIAAKAFLDVSHDPVDNAATNDDNNYTLGSIGKHNVVIAVLPYGQYGLVNASAALKDMTRTFSNLRAVLMVGIGGCVPGKKDIRLGDIVVGSVGRNSSGVIQYDYGRAVQGEEFSVTGHLNQPPVAFLTAMSALHARYEMEGHSIETNIDKALENYKRLRKKYKRPDAYTDRLYRADIVHKGGEGTACSETCGNEHLVHRKERDDDENSPAIHYALIASGNSLMKNALLRDKLAAKHGILCFEMEAAGLMNHFPCVVIRGICDYSDTHKNDEWQDYAAMAAAAYTKDLLLQVAPSSVQREERIETFFGHLSEKVDHIHQLASESSRNIKSLSCHVQDDAISRWLNPADPSVDHNKARKAWHSGTGQWLLNSSQYLTWKSRKDSFLWLNGYSGRGKTVLSSTVIEDIRNSLPELCDSALLYFYITFTDNRKQSLEAILTSFVSQLYYNSQKSRHPIISLYSQCGSGKSEPNIEQLKSTFREMLSLASEVFIVIDALDEYRNRSAQRHELFAWIESFGIEPVNTHLLVTSRPEHDIKTSLETWADPESVISLKTDIVGRDISGYVRDVVTNSTSFRRWHGHTSTLDNIVDALTTKADGGFRWVALQLERLKECINAEEVNITLQTLPTTLQKTYYRVLSNLSSTRKKYVIRILQLLAYSDTKMELEAVVDALAVDLTAPQGSRFIKEDRMPLPTEISSLCSTLFFAVSATYYDPIAGERQNNATILQLAHPSVKEFILSCPRDTFDGLLTESTARSTILEICLVYYLEMDYSLFQEGPMRTHHLLPFATQTWLEYACCRRSGLDRFTHLSMELFSNQSLFKRWRELIGNLAWRRTNLLSYQSSDRDQLFYASWSGDKGCVKKLLDSNATRNASAWRLDPALLIASEFGHLGVVTLLLREGADANAKGRINSALCSAVNGGHADVVTLLVQEGADIDIQEGIYDIASQRGCLDIVDLLISRGADVNTETHMDAALYSASNHGRLDIVMHLIEKGADVNAQTGSGTALQAASNSGHLNTVIFLLENGANIDAHSGQKYNALQLASRSGHLDVVSCLLTNGADVNAQREGYNDPGHRNILPWLVRWDLSTSGEEYFGRPLHLACYYGHSDIVTHLIKEGADVNAQGGYHGTAVRAAASGGHFDIVYMLLSEGADMDSRAGH